MIFGFIIYNINNINLVWPLTYYLFNSSTQTYPLYGPDCDRYIEFYFLHCNGPELIRWTGRERPFKKEKSTTRVFSDIPLYIKLTCVQKSHISGAIFNRERQPWVRTFTSLSLSLPLYVFGLFVLESDIWNMVFDRYIS